jgi:molybdate/tungstate transport system substrate-binding protein
LTVELLNKAAKVYNLPGLEHKVLGSPNNPAQVFPEEDLAARLQSGKLDVGFFYSTETADLKITAIALPAETAFSAHYTATILHNAPNPTGADHFLAYLLGPDGRAQMEQHGLHVLTPTFSGDSKDVPASIRAALLAAK